MTTFFRRVMVGLLCLSGGLALGCAGRNANSYDDGYPNAPGRTIIAQPGGYEDVYVADQQYAEQVVEGRQVVGYDTLSDGTQVQVVTYVHTYPDAIDTFPRVYWGGNWYYNVNGDFVYYSPGYGGWVYYWGPPAPLVSCWNVYYPWAPYYWGTGFYGAGWYWGGVGYYGYHAYGVPVVNEYHHHHHEWSDTNPGGPSSGHPGGPSDNPSTGGPADDGPARRTKPDQAPVAQRTKPPTNAPAPSDDPSRRTPAARNEQGDRVAGAAPQRDAAKRTVPVRTYTNSSGQRITTIDPQAGRVASTRNPSTPDAAAPARTSKSLGTVQSGPARDPFATRNTPRWDQPVATPGPSRDTSWDTRSPSRSPSSSPSRDAAPSRSFSPPSRSSEPSRSFSPPSRSEPSRSSSPPSRSAPSRSFSPSRSSPSRSMSPPSRSSAPSRSAPSRSFSPSSSGGGSRSSAPSRSSSGGGRSSSPSHGGGGRSSAPSRSSGGGSHRR